MKANRQPWKTALLWALLLLTLAIAWWIRWSSVRHLFPGNWLGHEGMLDPLYWFFCLAAALGTGLCLAFAWKRPWFALGTGLAAATWLLPLPTSDGLPRARAELEAYRHAVASSQPFGDQFEETAEGRTLIFWRWRSWGIDNSIGVIYDPKDALTREFMVFRQRTGGTLYTIKRIAPGYFLVTFS